MQVCKVKFAGSARLKQPERLNDPRRAAPDALARILLFAADGITRLVRRITKRSFRGSIHSDVPVNPLCP